MDVNATIRELKELFAKRENYAHGGGEVFWEHDNDRVLELSEALVFYLENRNIV